MNGLWHPPLRLLRSITVEEEGGAVIPFAFETRPDCRVLHYRSFTLTLSMPEHLVLSLGFEGESHPCICLNVDPSAVWLTESMPEWRLYGLDNAAVLEFHSERRRYLFTCGSGGLEISANTVRFLPSVDSWLYIREEGMQVDQAAEDWHVLGSTVLRSSNRKLEEVFYWSKMNLKWLYHRQAGLGAGITAGHPEFPWYFGIDTLLCTEAMLSIGMWRESADSIGLLSAQARRHGGRIPHEIVTNGRIYNMGDTEESALFPSAMASYYRWTQDAAFISEHISDAYASLKYVREKGCSGNGIMEDEERGRGVDVDTLCFYARGCSDMLSLLKAVSTEPPPDWIREEARVAAKRVRSMWLPELSIFANRVVDGVAEFRGFWTSIVPFVTGIADRRQFREFRHDTTNGISLISGPAGIRNDSGGSVMPVNNGLMALACWRYGDPALASKYYRLALDSFGLYMPCAMPEIVNRPDGCYLQAWSAAMIIEGVLSGALGMEIDKGIVLRPQLQHLASDISVSGVRVGNSIYTLHAQDSGRSSITPE